MDVSNPGHPSSCPHPLSPPSNSVSPSLMKAASCPGADILGISHPSQCICESAGWMRVGGPERRERGPSQWLTHTNAIAAAEVRVSSSPPRNSAKDLPQSERPKEMGTASTGPWATPTWSLCWARAERSSSEWNLCKSPLLCCLSPGCSRGC